jgi:uncharacterized membrane protein
MTAVPLGPSDSQKQRSRIESLGSKKFVSLAIFVLALGLRIFHLGDQNLWHDEQLTLAVSQVEGKDFLKTLEKEKESNKPPLYFLLMHYWLEGGTSEFWIRLPSAICGALTCLLALVLGNELFGNSRGWILGLVLAVAPFHIYYSQEARMYALLGLMGTAAMLCTVLFCKTQQWRYALLYLACATLSCYAFTYGVFLMPFSCLLSLAFQPQLPRKALFIIWGANILAALLFCPWVPRLLESVQSGVGLQSGLQSMSRAPVIMALGYAFFTLGFGTTFGPTTEQLRLFGKRIFTEDPTAGIFLAGGLLIAAVVILTGWKVLWQRNRNGFFFSCIGLVIFCGGPALLNFLNPEVPYNSRYAILAIVPFSVAATGLVFGALEKGTWRKAAMLLFAGCIGTSLANNFFASKYARDDIRSAVRFVESLNPPPDAVIVCTNFMKRSVRYYYQGNVPLLPLDVGSQPIEDVLQPFESELARARTLGVIYTRPDYGDPQRILPAWLAQHYHLKLQKTWTGVTFYLFDTGQ